MNDYRVIVGMPGPNLGVGTALSWFRCGEKHHYALASSPGGWDAFDLLWAGALKAAAEGSATHFAMIHSDVVPDALWCDTIIDEMDRLGADLISVPSAIKDNRGVFSSGIGNPDNPWHPYRRITLREMANFPETFNAADIGYPGYPLLHNSALWVADLRNPLFRTINEAGEVRAMFAFPRRIVLRDGEYVVECESEDWYFSRALHDLGAKTWITRKVKMNHVGSYAFPNHGNCCGQEHDEATRELWCNDGVEWKV